MNLCDLDEILEEARLREQEALIQARAIRRWP